MVPACRSVSEFRRDDELTTSADLHSGNALLPALDELVQRKVDRFATIPRRIELLPRLEVDAHVVNPNCRTSRCLVAVTNLDVGDHKFGRWLTTGKVDFGLL